MSENFDTITFVRENTPEATQLYSPASTEAVVKGTLMVVGLFATVYFVTGKLIKLNNWRHNRKS